MRVTTRLDGAGRSESLLAGNQVCERVFCPQLRAWVSRSFSAKGYLMQQAQGQAPEIPLTDPAICINSIWESIT